MAADSLHVIDAARVSADLHAMCLDQVESLTRDAAPPLATVADVCRVLQPLFDIDGIRDLNGPCGWRLAELIHPRDAADLTVREVLSLLQQISAELEAAAGGAA